jgi:hypothetical protein
VKVDHATHGQLNPNKTNPHDARASGVSTRPIRSESRG